MSIRRLVQSGVQATLPERTEVWDLDSEEAGNAFDALSSDTARKTLSGLYEEPQTTSSLSKSLELSIQNTNYHIQNLREAGLVEVAATKYSDQGNEMKVYAPTRNAVLLLSNQSLAERIRSRLPEILAVGMLLGMMTLLFRVVVVERFIESPAEEPASDESPEIVPLSGNITADANDSGEGESFLQQVDLVTLVEEIPLWLDPGVTFAIGAIVGVFLVVLITHARRYR